MAGGGELPAYFMFTDSPTWIIAIWVAGSLCAVFAIVVTLANIRRHMQAATKAGMGFSDSFGPRGDLIIFLLWAPAIFAATGATQMFQPGAVLIMALLRIVFFAMATMRVVALLYVLAGGAEYVRSTVPKEPIRAFAAPPCCWCLFKVDLGKVYFGRRPIWWMTRGIKQFSWTAPVLGIYDIMGQERFGANDSRLVPLTILFTLVTLCAVHNYSCVTKLIAPIVRELTALKGPEAMAAFVKAHLAVCKLPDLVVNLIVKSDYVAEAWVLSQFHCSAIISGFLTCVLEVPLVLLGWKAFPLELYPPEPAYSERPPLDMMALLELNGIDPSRWQATAPLQRSPAHRQHSREGVLEMEASHPAAMVLGKAEQPSSKEEEDVVTEDV